MFANLSHYALQQYWWVIVSVLGALLVFLMFVQGGQTLIYTLARNDSDRRMLINALGRKWELTFTTLVTFGGAFFASFPLFYSTSFGGAYWVWIAILISFVIQAVAYEYRSKPANVYGRKTFETFLFLNGLLGTILIGTAVGTFFNGANFVVEFGHQGIATSYWAHPAHGLEAVLNLHNVALGLAVFFLARILGALFIHKQVESAEVASRIRKSLIRNTIPFLVFFLYFVIHLMFKDGYAYDPETGLVSMESYKYLHNILQMPLNTALLLAGVLLVLYGLFLGIFKGKETAFTFTGLGTVLTVLALFLLAGFNNTCYYPSAHDLQSSLNIRNSSSSHTTLTAMSWVSLLVPFVLAYIWYVWWSMSRKKITKEEMDTDSHVY
ncbi:MAG TPA: cytochrome d ubiquinol oxidase subunit II [Bacteroidales bacterium]|nr:cytochrome d ubiquinol oxidase subunit II [Bacteroidales bacterium]HRZ49902.1 cytochrome d ubiquinol oxidase subunit II [Bacteroidales bacterium]